MEVAVAQTRVGPETDSINDEIRVPIVLRDENGVAHVRAVFRRLRYAGELGPRDLDPTDTLELRGNGQNQKQATVDLTLKVADEHVPGDNPTPSRLFRIVDEGKRDDKKTEFFGWGD